MRVLNKYSYWWKKEEKEWAWQDKHGTWWISKSDNNSMKPPVKKRQKQRSNRISVETYLAIVGASAMGIILGALVFSLF